MAVPIPEGKETSSPAARRQGTGHSHDHNSKSCPHATSRRDEEKLEKACGLIVGTPLTAVSLATRMTVLSL